ncbi:MAG TPA: hypothetical protein VLX28_20365 [Thermoanaerobaculia bacterium]|nr:hypothetical protein [Thermoanaerobaculia bacterium]
MLRPSGRAARIAAILGFVLHAAAALTAWWTWSSFGRGNVLAWIDFPVSLAFLHLDGKPFLFWSLLAGGLEWGAIAALLSLFLGRTVRGEREEEP